MSLNGIEITTRIPESVIEEIAEYVVEWITEDYSEEALDREGSDCVSLTRKLQADADFRKLVKLNMVELVDQTFEDLYYHDVSQEVLGTLSCDQYYDHWISDFARRLSSVDEELEQEESSQQEAEYEKTVAEQIAFLESQGYTVQPVDRNLEQALRTVGAAGYIAKKES